MKKLTTLAAVLVAALVIFAASGAFARDYWDNWTERPWERGDAGSTHQAWEFPDYSWSDLWTRPNISNNPYGEAHLEVQNPTFPDVVIGPDGTDINTLHIGDYDPETMDVNPLTIWIPNQPIPNPTKLVYIQITSDKYTYANTQPTVTTSGGTGASSVTSPYFSIQHPNGWYTYNWLIEIHPNPEWEQVTFLFTGSTNIEEIVVDTICIPEPGSFVVLGSGLVAGLCSLRRRKR